MTDDAPMSARDRAKTITRSGDTASMTSSTTSGIQALSSSTTSRSSSPSTRCPRHRRVGGVQPAAPAAVLVHG